MARRRANSPKSSSPRTTNSSGACPFLYRLPFEMRMEIYNICRQGHGQRSHRTSSTVFVDQPAKVQKATKRASGQSSQRLYRLRDVTPWADVCRQTRDEYANIKKQSRLIYCENPLAAIDIFSNMSIEDMSAVRHLMIVDKEVVFTDRSDMRYVSLPQVLAQDMFKHLQLDSLNVHGRHIREYLDGDSPSCPLRVDLYDLTEGCHWRKLNVNIPCPAGNDMSLSTFHIGYFRSHLSEVPPELRLQQTERTLRMTLTRKCPNAENPAYVRAAYLLSGRQVVGFENIVKDWKQWKAQKLVSVDFDTVGAPALFTS